MRFRVRARLRLCASAFVNAHRDVDAEKHHDLRRVHPRE